MAKRWSDLSKSKKQSIKASGGSKSSYSQARKANPNTRTRNVVSAATRPTVAAAASAAPVASFAAAPGGGGDNSAQYQHEASLQQQAHENNMAAQAQAHANAMAMQAAEFAENQAARDFQKRQASKDRATSYMNSNQKKGTQFQGNDFTGGAADAMNNKFGNNTYQPRGDMMREFNFADR